MSSDDPSGSGRNDEDDASPRQGRWLGAVRSWIGGGEEGEGAEPQGVTSSPAAASSPALSADEIRRRRLEKMEGSRSQQVYLLHCHALCIGTCRVGWTLYVLLLLLLLLFFAAAECRAVTEVWLSGTRYHLVHSSTHDTNAESHEYVTMPSEEHPTW